ncbi:hypothetical protein [Pilimelia terevasa]|uniref:hypothetical protein n=1 Tax=Pilimelia terevasa TaxID=53372 RepID=UPI00166CD8DD|nr:hypothetical protein [Pilimelia terevasa]
MADMLTGWADWLAANRDPVVLAAGAATVLLLALAAVVRRARSGRPDRWVDGVALVLTLAWSAEGMWEVSTGALDLGAAFAVPALFVFTIPDGIGHAARPTPPTRPWASG